MHLAILNLFAMKMKMLRLYFLPTNRTLLLQPLDQGITESVKTTYPCLVSGHFLSATDEDPTLDIMQCWESFTTADMITFIKAAMDQLKPVTVNNCWKHLWSEVVMILKVSQGSMEKLGKSFMGRDKLMEKDFLTSLMKKSNNILKATEKC